MRLSVRGKNGNVPDAVRLYAEKKVLKLERYFRSIDSVEIEESTERGQHIIELNVEGDGIYLRSEERCTDLYAAIDTVVDKMEKQVKRFKNRQRKGHQRPGAVKEATAVRVSDHEIGVVESDEDEVEAPKIYRRKRFPMKPMSAEEAANQMEMLDHNFFLFLNEDTNSVNVLYQRRNGDYGLIEPEI